MSTRFAFPPEPTPSLEITGRAERFPIHRIYCVGRNYEEHAREMGDEPDRNPPFFFQKPADAITPNRATVPYPSRTTILHHEIELVVAIGRGGRDITLNSSVEHIFGYAVGIDLTRRDLQNAAKKLGRPGSTERARS